MMADRVRSTGADGMSKMGLEVVSFTIKEVRDKDEYRMGRPDTVRIKAGSCDCSGGSRTRDGNRQ